MSSEPDTEGSTPATGEGIEQGPSTATDEQLTTATDDAGRPRRLEGFDRWAWVLCYGLAALGVVVGILAINGSVVRVDDLVLVTSIFIGVAMLSAVAWGLGARRSWGRPAAVMLLWILVALGLMRFGLLLFAVGDMTIPVEAILAAVVLTRLPRGHRRDIGSGSDRSIAIIYAGIYGLSALWPLVIR